MYIIATIGRSCSGTELNNVVTNCLKSEIRYFRFNLSKYCGKEEINTRMTEILRLQNTYKDIMVMLDIPYPYKKPRLFINNINHSVIMRKSETIYVSLNHNSEFFLDSYDPQLLRVGSHLVYSDGYARLCVKSVFDDGFVAEAENECILQSAKSVAFDYLIRHRDFKEYCDLVETINPLSIAFSFVSAASDILEIKEQINPNIELISKIESKEGLSNLEKIAQASSLMVARGDLVLNANYIELPQYQRAIIAAARRNQSNYYIATGILGSLGHRCIPSPAEIIDIDNIASCNPTGVILNFDVVKNEIAEVKRILTYLIRTDV